MLLAHRGHTVGNRRRYVVNYCEWLPEGDSVASATVVTSSITASITDVATRDNKVVFFVNGGAVNETFIAAIQIVTSRGEIKNDTIEFVVVPA